MEQTIENFTENGKKSNLELFALDLGNKAVETGCSK